MLGSDTSKAKQAEYNLAVLKRRDAAIQGILGSAGHVVLYQFNEENKAWDRKNVEGSLFVVERSSAPRHQFVVLNRLSSENLVETVDESFQTELTEQFLLYRNSSSEILGVWFYSPPERAEIADLLGSLTAVAPPGPSAHAPPADGSIGPNDPPPPREDAALELPGSSNNVAQFFNMMAGVQQAPPPMPARAITAAVAPDVRSSPATGEASAPPTGGARPDDGANGGGGGAAAAAAAAVTAAAGGAAASSGRPPVDMTALKAKLGAQLRSLVDDDTFLSLLASEYLRQQQRAMQQVSALRRAALSLRCCFALLSRLRALHCSPSAPGSCAPLSCLARAPASPLWVLQPSPSCATSRQAQQARQLRSSNRGVAAEATASASAQAAPEMPTQLAALMQQQATL